MDKYWLALYTKPRSEFKAEEQLINSNITTYLPKITRLKQWSDRKKKITEPLLRGYIFIYADEQERLISVEKQAVVRCLFDGGRPARIPEWQIDNIRKMLDSNSEVIVHNGIVPGVKVMIKGGSFKGVIGTVMSEASGKSISVSIDLLNRSIIAHLPENSELEIVKDL